MARKTPNINLWFQYALSTYAHSYLQHMYAHMFMHTHKKNDKKDACQIIKYQMEKHCWHFILLNALCLDYEGTINNTFRIRKTCIQILDLHMWLNVIKPGYICFLINKMKKCGARERAPWIRALAAFAEDPDSVSDTRIRWLTTTCNPSSSRLCRYLYLHMLRCTYIQIKLKTKSSENKRNYCFYYV